ncbi:SRPBCC domain-containing protein [Bacillus sp. MRMR6]|uniref:SRPBCC domain-containing protein n=1 Tax=Bacillus sp. MRMR6 TaxID=1928617 RepID=UPI000951A340|nr:SRPBCC domain-containing protein [Bacillus sp. MRMR6]OLS40408.1 carbon monoxide dehydrogenase [Bacillus sp. MRMR6]
MKIKYEYTFGLPRRIVWKFIKDQNVLRNSISGCKSFVESSSGVYKAEVEISMGPIKDHFIIDICRQKELAPSFYRLHVKGKGNLGEIEAYADLNFYEAQGGTKLSIVADAEVTGALSVAAKRMLDGGANKGLERFFQKLEREIKVTLYKLKREGR